MILDFHNSNPLLRRMAEIDRAKASGPKPGTICGFPFDFLREPPKPRPKRVKVTRVETEVTLKVVTTRIEIEDEDDGCPTGCRPTDPPDSPPRRAVIEHTTGTLEIETRRRSIEARPGSSSGPSSCGRIPSASDALRAGLLSRPPLFTI